jgi:F-type H+-transporting ATPase subunit b
MQIDWFTVGAQILNFLILVWLLQRFLYGPITRAMARREARIEGGLAEIRDGRAGLEEAAAKLAEDRAALDARRAAMLETAREEARALRARLESELRAEMEVRRASWQAGLEAERAAFADTLRRKAGHQVIEIVARILRDYAGTDLAGHMAGVFADRLAALEPERKEALRRAAQRAGPAAEVESSVPLSSGARSAITRALHEGVAPGIEVAYREDPDLLLGVRLTIGEQTLEWSAGQFLHRLETALDEIIDGAGRGAAAGPAIGA